VDVSQRLLAGVDPAELQRQPRSELPGTANELPSARMSGRSTS